MRATWTDHRLDDFARHTDARFDAIDQRFEAVDRRFEEVGRRFEAVDRRLDQLAHRMDAGFDRLDGRIDALHHTMLRLGVGTIVTVAIGFAGLVATQL